MKSVKSHRYRFQDRLTSGFFCHANYTHVSQSLWRISMKMSSRRAGLEGGSVAQHRPQHVDPPTSEGDHCLGVPLALSPLTVVESPGLRDATQAGERRLVEDPLENPVAAAPLAVVSNPLTGVAGGTRP